MNRDELSKMSRDDIINMLLEQQKGTGNTVKPVKSLLELPANQLERSIKRPSKLPEPDKTTRVKSLKHHAANAMVKDKIKFFEDNARESESVITYAKKPVSIADMRHEELDKNKSIPFYARQFIPNLFGERLKHMPGKRGKCADHCQC